LEVVVVVVIQVQWCTMAQMAYNAEKKHWPEWHQMQSKTMV
jgi:hypothetical protein